jgi:DNA helicase-2/ATP-dependent DNA helicase PcrA
MLDRFYRKRYKILGGPGCGKTTKILDILADYIKAGVNLDEVLLIGFAKATAEELRARVIKNSLLTEKQAESIKTIHKFCLDHIGKHDILNSSVKKDFKKRMASDPDTWVMLDDEKYDRNDEEPAQWTQKEDRKLAVYYDIINKAHHSIGFDKRNKYKDDLNKILSYFRESVQDNFKNVHTAQLTYFYTNLKKFKSQTGVIDFDDMLLKALYPTVEFPSYKLVLVDEVQDLSKLEWQVISKIAQKTEELFLVGDDDQAIYAWKGSDVKIFQKWPCKKENVTRLETSYRLPGKIYDFALSIRNDIRYRLGNEFTCQKRIDPNIKDEGHIAYINGLDEIENLNENSQIIFCARARSLLRPYADFLKQDNLIWLEKSQGMDDRGKFKSSFPSNCQEVIESWNTLQEGYSIKGTDYIKMVKQIDIKFISERKKTALSKKDTAPVELYEADKMFSYEELKNKFYLNAPLEKMWHEIFYFDTTRIQSATKPKAIFRDREDFNDYLKGCWEKNKNLTTEITLSTIHGVKGMEAEKVVLAVEWGFSLKKYKMGNQKDEDDELRVCYVGVTRAKKELYLFEPPGQYKNPFPLLQTYLGDKYDG